MKVEGEVTDVDLLHDSVPLPPAVLPNLSWLTFSPASLSTDYADLPGLSPNKPLTTVSARGILNDSPTNWLCLPPTLQHQTCAALRCGLPPSVCTSKDRLALGCLETVICEFRLQRVLLHHVAEFRCVPALANMETLHSDRGFIQFGVGDRAVPANLALLLRRMEIEQLSDASYLDDCSKQQTDALIPIFEMLPRMTGVAECEFTTLHPAPLRASMLDF